MAKNCFDGIAHESLDFCSNDENSAGVSTRVFYAPVEFFDKIETKSTEAGYAAKVTIPEAGIVFKETKGWKGIDVLVDNNELKNMFVGNKGNLKAKTELEIFIPGIRPEVVGFLDTYKNVPMVFAVQDSNGVFWIVGNTVNAAFFESADGTTGKKYEDDAGVAAKISANTRLSKFAGAITEA